MDGILRTLICGGQVSLTLLNTRSLVQRAIDIHGLSAQAARILGGLLTGGAYCASCLKGGNSAVSLTVKAENGDGAVSVSADAALHVRGYADGTCSRSLKGGTLTVVREDGGYQPFVGTCEIESDGVSDILSAYFQQSEQIPTAVALRVEIGDDGSCVFAGGAVLQLLPDAEDEQIDRAAAYLEDYVSRYGGEERPLKEILEECFGEPYGEVSELFPEYACNCSEEKIKSVLAAVGREELLKIAQEQGAVTVHCHYCNKDYVYDRKRIEETFLN